jgi:transposase
LQVATALRQIDQLDLELDPLERWLRAFARRQPGCRALIDRHYGIGMLIAPTILAELGDARRLPTATRCATPAWTSPSTAPTASAAPGTCPAKAPGAALGVV